MDRFLDRRPHHFMALGMSAGSVLGDDHVRRFAHLIYRCVRIPCGGRYRDRRVITAAAKAYQAPSQFSPRSVRHIAQMARGSLRASFANPTVICGRKHPRALLDSTLDTVVSDAKRPVAARRRAFDVMIAGPAVNGVGDVFHGIPFYPLSRRKPPNLDPPIGHP